MSAHLPVIDPSRGPDAREPDYRPDELAAERAECATSHVLDWMCNGGGDGRGCSAEWGAWIDLSAARRKLARGDDCTTDELLVLALREGPAGHLLMERMRDDPAWLRMVRNDFLADAIEDIADSDAEDAAAFAIDAYCDREAA